MFVTVNVIVVEVLCSVHSGVELFQTRYVIVLFERSHAKVITSSLNSFPF